MLKQYKSSSETNPLLKITLQHKLNHVYSEYNISRNSVQLSGKHIVTLKMCVQLVYSNNLDPREFSEHLDLLIRFHAIILISFFTISNPIDIIWHSSFFSLVQV